MRRRVAQVDGRGTGGGSGEVQRIDPAARLVDRVAAQGQVGVEAVGIVARPADQRVVAGAAVERIITGAAVDGVVAGAAGQGILGDVAGDPIVAGAAGDVLEVGRLAGRPGLDGAVGVRGQRRVPGQV